jgi:hypothetical protein
LLFEHSTHSLLGRLDGAARKLTLRARRMYFQPAIVANRQSIRRRKIRQHAGDPMSSILLRACATILNGAAISLVAHPALAADAANEESTAAQPVLFEVVVTAQKREQRAQDVPISVAVMGGGDLDRSSLKSVSDALGQVPAS